MAFKQMKFSSGVIKDQGLGKALGFPTANLVIPSGFSLPFGVYSARVRIFGEWRKAALHFGPRPAIGKSESSLEAHILDFSGDLYGTLVEVEVGDFLREIQTFASTDALKEQMRRDCDRVRERA